MNLETTLTGRFDKATVSTFISENPAYFEELLTITLNYESKLAWRAAWVLNHVIKKNDTRLTNHISNIIEVIPKGDHSLQRELLKTLLQLQPTEDQEGQIFDLALIIWQDISKQPAVRSTAFKHVVNIAKKHPEIKNEIPFLIQPHYIESLSPGIKRSVEKMTQQFK